MPAPHRPARTIAGRIEELTALMEQMARLIPQMMRGTQGSELGFELTHHQFVMLCVLEVDGAIPMAVLREKMGAAQSSASEMVGRMAKLGYVEKRVDPEDSRAVVVAPTARGRRVVRARRDHIREQHRMVLERLSSGDQDRFVAATRTIVTLMLSVLGDQSGDHENA